MSERQPIPLFVIGTARSGTTWIANLLISHPAIAGLAAEVHHGVHESHLLDHTRYALPGVMSCTEFVARYALEDYWRLARIDAAEFCLSAPARGDAVGFFRALMDAVARRDGARYWIEKTPKHAIYYQELLRRFPDARFLVIRRRFLDVVRSQLGTFGRADAGAFRQRAEKVFRYESDARAVQRLFRSAPGRVLIVSYEDLVANTALQTARVLNWLGLESASLISRYEAASSFGSGRGPRPQVGWVERAMLESLRLACRLMPFAAQRALRERRDRQSARAFPKYALVPG